MGLTLASAAGRQLAQPILNVAANAGHHALRLPLAAPFDPASITDGNDDGGPLGPEQDIAAVQGGVRVLVSLAGRADEAKGDVEVYQASVDLSAAKAPLPATATLPLTGLGTGSMCLAAILIVLALFLRRPSSRHPW